jgi:hypothetical protein
MDSALEGKSGGFQCRIQAGFFHSKGQPTSQMKEEVDGKQILMFCYENLIFVSEKNKIDAAQSVPDLEHKEQQERAKESATKEEETFSSSLRQDYQPAFFMPCLICLSTISESSTSSSASS